MAVLEHQGGGRETGAGKIITLPGAVLFQTAKSELMPSARARLETVAQALKDMPNKHVTVEGFTDNTGTDAVNQPLSEARAQAVKEVLGFRRHRYQRSKFLPDRTYVVIE